MTASTTNLPLRRSDAGAVLSCGLDIVSIERIETMITHYGDSFRHRVYSESEAAYCERQANPPQHYAARWAAKEAAIKALPKTDRPVPLSGVVVDKDGSRPTIAFEESRARESLDRLANRNGADSNTMAPLVSLSHDATVGYAIAQVLITTGVER